MAENTENHGFNLPGKLTEAPMTLQQLAEWNRSINAVSAYARETPDGELQRHLQTVIGMVSVFLCNICYENNVDPFALDYWDGKSENFIVTPFEPEIVE